MSSGKRGKWVLAAAGFGVPVVAVVAYFSYGRDWGADPDFVHGTSALTVAHARAIDAGWSLDSRGVFEELWGEPPRETSPEAKRMVDKIIGEIALIDAELVLESGEDREYTKSSRPSPGLLDEQFLAALLAVSRLLNEGEIKPDVMTADEADTWADLLDGLLWSAGVLVETGDLRSARSLLVGSWSLISSVRPFPLGSLQMAAESLVTHYNGQLLEIARRYGDDEDVAEMCRGLLWYPKIEYDLSSRLNAEFLDGCVLLDGMQQLDRRNWEQFITDGWSSEWIDKGGEFVDYDPDPTEDRKFALETIDAYKARLLDLYLDVLEGRQEYANDASWWSNRMLLLVSDQRPASEFARFWIVRKGVTVTYFLPHQLFMSRVALGLILWSHDHPELPRSIDELGIPMPPDSAGKRVVWLVSMENDSWIHVFYGEIPFVSNFLRERLMQDSAVEHLQFTNVKRE